MISSGVLGSASHKEEKAMRLAKNTNSTIAVPRILTADLKKVFCEKKLFIEFFLSIVPPTIEFH
jgi:hypothetical protein